MKKIIGLMIALFSMGAFAKQEISNKALVSKQQAHLKAAAEAAIAHQPADAVQDRAIRQVPQKLLDAKSIKSK